MMKSKLKGGSEASLVRLAVGVEGEIEEIQWTVECVCVTGFRLRISLPPKPDHPSYAHGL